MKPCSLCGFTHGWNTPCPTGESEYAVGDHVRKASGEYAGATGWIVAVFSTRAGKIRYVMEFEALPGLLHIFSGSQLGRVL